VRSNNTVKRDAAKTKLTKLLTFLENTDKTAIIKAAHTEVQEKHESALPMEFLNLLGAPTKLVIPFGLCAIPKNSLSG